jgi:hypothetical protein
MDALPAVPTGMGPSLRPDSINDSSIRAPQESGAGSGSPAQASASSSSARRPEGWRSSIVEKPPSFKFKNDVVPVKGLVAGKQGSPRSLLRVKSLEEQVAFLQKQPQPAYKWPAGRPSANVR